jgi:hypothetical protein
MTLHQLQQTRFHVEPLKNIVGIGDITAYQIVITTGPALGTIGSVSVPAQADVCNDPNFGRNYDAASGMGLLASWFRRTLATLRS